MTIVWLCFGLVICQHEGLIVYWLSITQTGGVMTHYYCLNGRKTDWSACFWRWELSTCTHFKWRFIWLNRQYLLIPARSLAGRLIHRLTETKRKSWWTGCLLSSNNCALTDDSQSSIAQGGSTGTNRSAGYRLNTPEEASYKWGRNKRRDRGRVSHRETEMKQTFPSSSFSRRPTPVTSPLQTA